jgi:predicted regulator of Ras-like GTPase activity (Roadblock/LC7/MglB family)
MHDTAASARAEFVANLGGLGWLLEKFVARVPCVQWAVLASRDGLTHCFAGLGRDGAHTMGALASGYHSLGSAAPDVLGVSRGRRVRQVVVEHDDYLLFVLRAGQGTLLAVKTRADADPGLIGHETGQLVKSVGDHLATPQRPPAGDGQDR